MTAQSTELARRQSDSLAQTVNDEVVTIAPPVDVYENKDEILVVVDFPAVPADGVTVGLEGAELCIEGTQKRLGHDPDMPARHLRRTFRVPNTVDPEGITASLKEGVLYVHLAKSEQAKPRRIEVQVA